MFVVVLRHCAVQDPTFAPGLPAAEQRLSSLKLVGDGTEIERPKKDQKRSEKKS